MNVTCLFTSVSGVYIYNYSIINCLKIYTYMSSMSHLTILLIFPIRIHPKFHAKPEGGERVPWRIPDPDCIAKTFRPTDGPSALGSITRGPAARNHLPKHHRNPLGMVPSRELTYPTVGSSETHVQKWRLVGDMWSFPGRVYLAVYLPTWSIVVLLMVTVS